jgi:hypothetical protein
MRGAGMTLTDSQRSYGVDSKRDSNPPTVAVRAAGAADSFPKSGTSTDNNERHAKIL